MKKYLQNKPHGFTLIEIAIVLVVIGIILGIVFKGKNLIDQTRVKSLAAQYNKIIGAIHIFYDRYGFYPGDGCNNTPTPTIPAQCTTPRNGRIDVQFCGGGGCSNEAKAFWYLLISTEILQENDRRSVFGQDWVIWEKNVSGSGLANWLDLPGGAQADPRIVCALDKMIDDSKNNAGVVTDEQVTYTPATDCWTLTGQGNPKLKILP